MMIGEVGQWKILNTRIQNNMFKFPDFYIFHKNFEYRKCICLVKSFFKLFSETILNADQKFFQIVLEDF